MPDGGPRVRATILLGLDRLLGSRGGPPLAKLLSEVGIDPGSVNEADADIPLSSYARLLDIAGQAIGEENFGLEAAKNFPVGGTGVLGYLVTHAPDMRSFLRCLGRFLQLQVDDVRIDLDEDRGVARLTSVMPDTLLAPRKQLIEFMQAILTLRIRDRFGADGMPLKAEFEYREPVNRSDYEGVFGRCVRFEAGVNRLTFRADALVRPNQQADALLFRTLSGVAEAQLKAIARSREGLKGASGQDLLTRLANFIIANLDSGRADIERAADSMGLSVRELQIELRRRDTSFAHEISRIRHGLAERYLRETKLPMSEIALLLGFSELSAFTRASKGWFGKTPTAVRHEQAGGAGAG